MVFKAQLIVGQPGNHVFSQLPAGYTRIKDRPLIEPLINADYRVIKASSVYKKVLPAQSLIAVVYLLLYLLYKIALTNRVEINIANNTKLRANA